MSTNRAQFAEKNGSKANDTAPRKSSRVSMVNTQDTHDTRDNFRAPSQDYGRSNPNRVERIDSDLQLEQDLMIQSIQDEVTIKYLRNTLMILLLISLGFILAIPFVYNPLKSVEEAEETVKKY